MTKISCSVCGIEYHIPAHYCAKRQQDHKSFFCPNGHPQHFPQDSEADVLRRRLQRTEADLVAEKTTREKAERAAKRLKRQVKP